MSYQLYKIDDVVVSDGVILNHDSRGRLFIPFDPANSDYQEYLEWLAEGNTPEAAASPADEV